MMGGSGRCSNRALAGLALLAALTGGCTEELAPIEGTTSFRVELVSPADPGSDEERLDSSLRTAEIRVTALDTAGEVDAGFSGDVDVYSHYLGNLTPELGETPLATAPVEDGESGVIAVELPQVYGPTFLWVEHARGEEPTHATGTSPTLWYRDPFLEDISRPLDEERLDALESSPLEEKQVRVRASRYGERGRLVATGIYAQGYTVSDVECRDAAGTPPCTAGPYDHLFVFSFSRAEIEGGGTVARGHVVSEVGGSVSEFNGLTEIGFPQTFVDDREPRPELLPEPAVLDPQWLQPANNIEMERLEAALIAVEDATVCPLDEEFETFSQWKLDVGFGCMSNDVISVISEGEVSDFKPGEHVGAVLPRVVGTLRPINIGSFHVWILYPRDIDDITLP